MKFRDLVDIEQLKSLFENFTHLTDLSMSLLEYPSQEILFGVGWKDICTKFHRVNPESSKGCLESNKFLTSRLKDVDDISIKHCSNGLVDGCAPIIVDGHLIATLFSGQIFFEKPDVERFKEQAKKFGFDEALYLEALKKIPVIPEERFIAILRYFSQLALVLAEIGLLKKNLIEQHELIKKKEEELNSSQLLLTSTLQNSPAGIIIVDENMAPKYINDWVPRIFGQSKESLMKFSFDNPHLEFKTLTPDRKELALKDIPLTRAVIDKIESSNNELIIKRKDGTESWVLSNASPILDNDGNFLQAITIILDITKGKTLEKELLQERMNLEKKVKERTKDLNLSLVQLEKANQHKKQFLTSMSHELRTPLNAILGFTQVLNLEYFGSLTVKQSEYVNLLKESSEHLLSLIDDLLDLSKIDAGSFELQIEPFSIIDLVAEMTKLMSNQFREKDINFTSKVKIKNEFIEADKRKIKQVFFNLLSNSLKFTPSGGNIDLEVNELHYTKEIRFTVVDSGIGIKEEDKDKIFSEFFQSDQLVESSIKGTGVGLALSKKLVEMHGGEIGFESDYKKGSTFWFTVPISKKLRFNKKKDKLVKKINII